MANQPEVHKADPENGGRLGLAAVRKNAVVDHGAQQQAKVELRQLHRRDQMTKLAHPGHNLWEASRQRGAHYIITPTTTLGQQTRATAKYAYIMTCTNVLVMAPTQNAGVG